jgi:hypothetical protein
MPGIVPKLISGKPNLASVEAKIMSHCTRPLSQLLLSNAQDKTSAYQQGQLEAASELKAVSSILVCTSMLTYSKASHSRNDGLAETLKSIVQVLQPPTLKSLGCGDGG